MPRLLPRLQLARKWKQLGHVCFDDAWHLRGHLSLAEIQFLDLSGAFFDLVGGDQDLPDVRIRASLRICCITWIASISSDGDTSTTRAR
jgi:hypothetical protein